MDYQEISSINNKAYLELFHIENKLRIFILNVLSKKENWWDDFKNDHLAKHADARKKGELSYDFQFIHDLERKIKAEKNHSVKSTLLMHDIYYTTMMDLYKIIKKYWSEEFSTYFGKNNKELFFHMLQNVSYIRNKVMHSKPIICQESRDIINMNKYLIDILKDIDIDFEKFIFCEPVSDILKRFFDEINIHNNIYENDKYENSINCSVFYKSKNEWWWKSRYFDEWREDLDCYYIKVEELNKKIEQYLNTHIKRYDVMIIKQEFGIEVLCDNILTKLETYLAE